jgi:hypothetical protein
VLENRECRKLIAESDELVRTVKGGTELTEDEWVAKLRKMKEETEKEIRESRYAEQHLREKYKDEPTKIVELLRAKRAGLSLKWLKMVLSLLLSIGA